MRDAPTPNTPDPLGPEAAAERIGARLRWSRRALWAERIARAFWPLYALICGGLAIALLAPVAALPFWPHVATLAAFALAAAALAVRGARTLKAPTTAQALARLDAGATDGPASALFDRLESGAQDPAARAIWAAHRARMAAAADRLRPAPPDLRLSSHDRWALRYAAPLSLLGALFLTSGEGGARLDAALSPARAAAAAEGPALSIEAWATPPVYTGAPPVYLTGRADAEPIPLPVGTLISVQVFDAGAEPSLSESIGDPGATARFVTDSGRGSAAEIALRRGGAVEVLLDGDPAAQWRFVAIPDQPPTIAFTAEPGPDAASLLEMSFAAADDYGVAGAWMRIEPDAEALAHAPAAEPFIREPITVELPLSLTGQETEAAETVSEDLTRHVWAGLPVTASLLAEDEIGQKGTSETVRFRLPQRRFYQPLARALIEQRRSLGWDLTRAAYVHKALLAATADPEAVFDDATAYLATRTAIRRLGYAIEGGRVDQEAASVIQLLWDAAVRIEDGDLSNAAERLRTAERNLRQALRDGASEDEIARLMDELRQAMADFLNQMARRALENPGSLSEMPQGEMLDQQTLERLMDQLENAARGGMRAQAEQLLSQLQRLLENLQMARPGQGQGLQGQGMEAMRELQDLIGKQQGLADESFREFQNRRGDGAQGQRGLGEPKDPLGEGESGQGQRPEAGSGAPGQDGSGGRSPGALAREQDGLRGLLDDLKRGLPQGLPDGLDRALDRAGRDMGDASDNLRADRPGDAVDDQVDALEALREGAEQLGEALREMARQQGGETGDQALEGPGSNGPELDPLGRPQASTGAQYGDSVRLPEDGEITRYRQLLDELRRRAGERARPREELDYIDRLMDRF